MTNAEKKTVLGKYLSHGGKILYSETKPKKVKK